MLEILAEISMQNIFLNLKTEENPIAFQDKSSNTQNNIERVEKNTEQIFNSVIGYFPVRSFLSFSQLSEVLHISVYIRT